MELLCGDSVCHNSTLWAPQARVSDLIPRRLGWNLSPEELTHVPEHWLAFPEPRPIYHYALGILYIFLFLGGVIGNGLVIWIFGTSKSLRTPSNIFVVNLAICDFIMMAKGPLFTYNSFNLGFAAGHIGCQIYGTVGSLSGIGASATNVVIAYDRYRTIATPFAQKMSIVKALGCLVLVWLYVLPWVLLPLLGQWNRFVPEGYLSSCMIDYFTRDDDTRTFVLVMFFVCYAIPLSFIIYFYSQIVSHVIIHEHNLREQAKKMNVETLRSNQSMQQTSAEVRITKAAVTMCFLFVASWTPYAVVSLIGAFGNQALLTPNVTMIPAIMCKLVGCIDPYIYAISHPRYRLELVKRFPWLEIQEEAISDTSSNGSGNTTATEVAPTA